MWAKKSLGQHFLMDKEALFSIVSAANLNKDDVVLEIGPGLGVLTSELVKHAKKVVAVEFDPNMIEVLKSTVPEDNLEVVREHVLKFNTTVLPKGYKIVANLPYYITSPILRNFLESALNKPSEIVFLIQKEVAERVTARPGNMSVLAVAVQLYGDPEIVRIVPNTSFWPKPKVDSAIIKIDVFSKPRFDINEKLFFRIVKAGFGEKRKTLSNSLSGGLQIPKEEVIKILENLDFDIKLRAEELSVEDWDKIYQLIKEKLS
ncbi:TPA: ribosomal RNA small subunit methyltransferase A [candidate division CPR2 bacterium]|nr:ribosomal RNA small subunit methyltransferase A [candidate division CPR2 bacterium]HCL99994.1 ribosomal RNA small subunit methyltransferase A [candidate division CPR2 bacterium]